MLCIDASFMTQHYAYVAVHSQHYAYVAVQYFKKANIFSIDIAAKPHCQPCDIGGTRTFPYFRDKARRLHRRRCWCHHRLFLLPPPPPNLLNHKCAGQILPPSTGALHLQNAAGGHEHLPQPTHVPERQPDQLLF